MKHNHTYRRFIDFIPKQSEHITFTKTDKPHTSRENIQHDTYWTAAFTQSSENQKRSWPSLQTKQQTHLMIFIVLYGTCFVICLLLSPHVLYNTFICNLVIKRSKKWSWTGFSAVTSSQPLISFLLWLITLNTLKNIWRHNIVVRFSCGHHRCVNLQEYLNAIVAAQLWWSESENTYKACSGSCAL